MTQATMQDTSTPGSRKWVWIVLAVLFLVIPGCVAAIMAGMKNSDAYAFSLAEIRNHAEAKAALGEPIETGMFVLGEINIKNADGHAAIQYTVRGPKGSGEAYVRATRQYSQWTLDEVVVDMSEARQRIMVVGRNAPATE